jgi:hypothetical protein
MMSLVFRDIAHPIDEFQRLLEIREAEAAGDVMLVHRVPLRHQLQNSL